MELVLNTLAQKFHNSNPITARKRIKPMNDENTTVEDFLLALILLDGTDIPDEMMPQYAQMSLKARTMMGERIGGVAALHASHQELLQTLRLGTTLQ